MNLLYNKKFYILIFLLFVTINFLYLKKKFEKEENKIKEKIILDVNHKIDLINKSNSKLLYYFYDENEIELSSELSKINLENKNIEELDNQKKLIREKLYKKFELFFAKHKHQQINLMHIHLASGESLVRFHKPQLYGDYISKKRYSLKKAKEEFKFVNGFEIGRYNTFFRYLYPLFFNGRYVGVLEFGSTFYLLKNNLDTYQSKIILNKNIVDKSPITTQTKQEHFIESTLSQNFIENKNYSIIKNENIISADKSLKLCDSFKKDLNRLNRDLLYKFKVNDEKFIILLTLLKNVKGKNVGYIVNYIKNDYYYNLLENNNRNLIFYTTTNTIVILLIVIFTLFSFRNKLYIETIINFQDNMVFLTNGKEIIFANKKLLDFLDFKSLKVLKKTHECICDFFIKESGYLHKTMDNKESWINHILNNKFKEHKVIMYSRELKENRIFVLKFKKFPLDNYNYIFSINDITHLETEAKIDKLTQVYNRSHFDQILKYEMQVKKRYTNKPISIIFFDIDYFKAFNDTYGHSLGDKVLSELCKVVKNELRASDTFARWGGEEFIILLPNSQIKESCLIANRLREKIEKTPIDGLKVTCSFGVTNIKKEDSEMIVLDRVDKNLYLAKERGRNIVICN